MPTRSPLPTPRARRPLASRLDSASQPAKVTWSPLSTLRYATLSGYASAMSRSWSVSRPAISRSPAGTRRSTPVDPRYRPYVARYRAGGAMVIPDRGHTGLTATRAAVAPVGDLAVGQAAAGEDDDLALLCGEDRERAERRRGQRPCPWVLPRDRLPHHGRAARGMILIELRVDPESTRHIVLLGQAWALDGSGP